jgi:hypothetical protein
MRAVPATDPTRPSAASAKPWHAADRIGCATMADEQACWRAPVSRTQLFDPSSTWLAEARSALRLRGGPRPATVR